MSAVATRSQTGTSNDLDAYRNPIAERIMEELGLAFELTEIALGSIDKDRSLSNQARLDPVRAEVVDRYTAALTGGARFPAIIVADLKGRRVIAGGNHRFLAHEAAGEDSIMAYVASVPNEETFQTLANLDNARHGVESTLEERLLHAADAVSQGATPADAANQFGVSSAQLATFRKATLVIARLRSLGINARAYASLPYTALAKISTNMTDDAVKVALKALNAGISPQRVADAVSGTYNVTPYTARTEVQIAALDDLITARSDAGKLLPPDGTKGKRRGSPDTTLLRLQGALTVIRTVTEPGFELTEQQAAVLTEIREAL